MHTDEDGRRKKKYMVHGNIRGIGFIREFVWAYSERQALKLVHNRLANDVNYKGVVIPPLGPYCQTQELPQVSA